MKARRAGRPRGRRATVAAPRWGVPWRRHTVVRCRRAGPGRGAGGGEGGRAAGPTLGSSARVARIVCALAWGEASRRGVGGRVRRFQVTADGGMWGGHAQAGEERGALTNVLRKHTVVFSFAVVGAHSPRIHVYQPSNFIVPRHAPGRACMSVCDCLSPPPKKVTHFYRPTHTKNNILSFTPPASAARPPPWPPSRPLSPPRPCERCPPPARLTRRWR